MAAASPVQGLQEEVTCSICLEYFTDPVSTKCGHNFCRLCISACSEGAGATLSCPQCRELGPEGDLRANRQLQSMVQLVKQLSLQQERPPWEGLCEEHEERLKLFCDGDEKLICLVCRESSAHKQHKVSPVKEAAERYKCEFQDSLKVLREQMGTLQQRKLKEEEGCRILRTKLEAERKRIESEFKQLQQTLKEQEETLLRRLEEMEKKISTVEKVNIVKLLAEMSPLENLVREIEKKCEQPAEELLKDIRYTLNRCEQVMPTGAQIKKYKVRVTLDADTAHRKLVLSEDGRRVTGTHTVQYRPDSHRRFMDCPCVLGREGFTSGRHYWELQLLEEGVRGWAVGVARESVSRKGGVTHSPAEGVWAVHGYKGKYQALTSSPSPPFPLSPCHPPLKLGVYLDYAGGRLSVYNADTLEELHTFTVAAFPGKVRSYLPPVPSSSATFLGRVHPYFWLEYGADLRIV